MSKFYYAVFVGKEGISRPHERDESKEEMQKYAKDWREMGARTQILTGAEYKELTGRSASRDYHAEKSCQDA